MKPAEKERDETDQALLVEREQTDVTFAERQERIAEGVDDTVKQARVRADEVLANARATADEKIADATSRETVERERKREEHTLRAERAAADVIRDDERNTGAQALAELLRQEREDTDRYLDSEREQADAVIASRDAFLGMVAHDLRSLLGTMAMSAAVLKTIPCEGSVSERIQREAARQQRCTARMARLVGDLVDVVSIDAGKLHLTRATADAGQLVREAVEAFEALAGSRKISLSSRIGEGSLRGAFDHGRILQVLTNLVSNAVKFTKEGGSVVVSAELVGADIRFSVKDDGPGIAPDKIAACFERYWQGAPADGRGLGLGLYISKSIVVAHGGKIWVESTPGKGSTFFFDLAAAP